MFNGLRKKHDFHHVPVGNRRNPKTICNARKHCSYYFTITEYYRRSDNRNAFVGMFGSGT